MTQLTIVLGPQGSGNHLWSKILSSHHDVEGWDALQSNYWIGHDQEPFAAYWENPKLLCDHPWHKSKHWVTGISVPYMLNGVSTIPDVEHFINVARSEVDQVKIAFLSRDQNIIVNQQQRLREQVTINLFEKTVNSIKPDCFLSFEKLQLYGDNYLKYVSKELGVPIDLPICQQHIKDDANHKYIRYFDDEDYWLDQQARRTSSKWR